MMIRSSSCAALCLYMLALATVAHCAAPYQFPIVVDQQHRRAQLHAQTQRRAPESGLQALESVQQQQADEPEQEARQLQQLHQVVDSMAALLSEQEQQGAQNQQQQGRQASPLANAHDLMSESEIRAALEELEKVQQHERQAIAAESQQRPVVAPPPNVQQQQQQQQQQSDNKAYDSLMDELGDEFIDEQLGMASQEAERLLQQRDSPRLTGNGDLRPQQSQAQEQKAPVSAALQKQQQPQANSSASSSAVSTSTEALYTGQLDSSGAELGPALTNDFYSFHALGESAKDKVQPATNGQDLSVSVQVPNEQQQAQGAQQKASSVVNDLDSAAQTRSSRHNSRPPNGFDQDPSANLRFDLSQPSPLDGHLPEARPPHNHENLVRQFRQQAVGPNVDNGQFPTSTLVPIASPDQFWRPASSPLDNNQQQQQQQQQHQQQQPGLNEDIAQQYNRLHQQQQPQLPPLPPPRFQSLSPAPPPQAAGPFSQPSPIPIPRHVHFTGHSFVPSNGQAQFSPPQSALNTNNNNRDRAFSSTSPPMISVLSGGDTSVGNSVIWNPPAAAPAPPKLFNQQFPSSNQQSQQANQIINTESPQTFFPPPPPPQPSQGPPSPLFNGAFQGQPQQDGRGSRAPLNDFRPQNPAFFPSTEISNRPIETTTEEKFPSPVTTTQRSVQPQLDEREASNSEPRSAIRSVNNQRYFPSNELNGPTSTPPSMYTEPARTSRVATTTSAPTTTPSTLTTPSGLATNTTKKDDMVIYYYYYYDDNKNATVVAKNVTSRPPTLDEAIEADAGVEDTPYMDDPAPGTNTRTSPSKPPVPSTTTSTTTTTTTTAASVTVNPAISTGMRTQPAASSRFNSVDQDSDVRVTPENPFNQPRNSPNPTRFTPGHASRQTQEASNSFTTTPLSTTSQRPSSRLPLASHDAPVTHTNRFTPTESTRFSPVRESHHHHHQQPQQHHHHQNNQHHPTSTQTTVLKNNKLQNDLIQNALNNPPPNTQVRQLNSLSTVPTPVTPNTSNRGASSNVSRYGTNNNLLLDPYGLDPSAPATLVNSGHLFAPEGSVNQHHKNWQSSTSNDKAHTTVSNGVGNRKPSQVTPTSARESNQVESVSPKNQAVSASTRSSNNNNNQQFSSQRSSSSIAPTPLPSLSSRVTSSQSVTRTSSTSGARQVFPETNGNPPHEQITRIRQPNHDNPTSRQPTTPDVASNGKFATSNSDGESQEISRESTPPRLSNNGRPSTPDGNTGNGFTRSPAQASSPVTPMPPSSTTSRMQNNERTSMTPLSSVSNTLLPTSFSTSTSKSVNILSSQPPFHASSPSLSSSSSPSMTTMTQSVSTSMSSTTSTSTTTATSSSSSSTSPPSSSTPASPETTIAHQTTVSTAPSSSSTTAAPIESFSSTESSDSSLASTRKKFGNRNNRFNTRLNSVSASASRSTSTTSTTPSPSATSTTRRPTTSTTRKSSKLLFAGRKRLSSINQVENNSNSSLVTSSTASIASQPATPSAESAAQAPASTPTGRARFGNSFTARSRSTTSSPANNLELNTQLSAKPASLFGAQRTAKPRLPFMRGTTKPTTSTTTETVPSASGEPASGSLSDIPAETIAPMVSSEKPIQSEKPLTGEISPTEETSENSVNSVQPTEEDSTMKKEAAPEVMTTPSPPPPSSSPQTSTQESTSGRNKPRVRPLFASRQRNTSLFGNRRSNNSTSTAA